MSRYLQVIAILAVIFGFQMSQAEILGFKAWKGSRIEEARANVERLRSESTPAETPAPVAAPAPAVAAGAPAGTQEPAANASAVAATADSARTRSPKAAKPDQRLEQAQLNVEIAQELSVNDYFVLYLSQFKNRNAFIEASRKLTPEELAELLLAYRNRMQVNETSTVRQSPIAGGLDSVGFGPNKSMGLKNSPRVEL